MTKEVCGDQKTSKSQSTFPTFPDGCFISFQIWFRPQINLKKCNLLQYHGSLLLLLFSFISLDLLNLKKNTSHSLPQQCISWESQKQIISHISHVSQQVPARTDALHEGFKALARV